MVCPLPLFVGGGGDGFFRTPDVWDRTSPDGHAHPTQRSPVPLRESLRVLKGYLFGGSFSRGSIKLTFHGSSRKDRLLIVVAICYDEFRMATEDGVRVYSPAEYNVDPENHWVVDENGLTRVHVHG